MVIAKIKKFLFNYSITDYSALLLCLFFVIYSLFSSNVPKVYGTEHFLMLSIAIILGFLYLNELRKLNFKEFIKINFLPLLILFIIIYGLILGLTLNNSNKNILRDMIGVISILSIFLLINLREKKKNYINFFFKILIYTGLIFSIKTLIFYYFFLDHSNYPHGNPIQVAKYHFLYLENTIILCLVFFLLKIYEYTEKKKFYKIIKYTFLLFFPLSVVEVYSIRGPIIIIFSIFLIFYTLRNKSFNGLIFSIFFLITSFFVYFIFIFYPIFYFIFHSKKKIIFILSSVLIILFIFDHIFLWSANFSEFTHKNILFDHKIKKFSVGLLNNRGQEFFVFQNNFNIMNIFFGKGFGALHTNPINNSNVLFFHNFSLYYFYKLGIVGILFISSLFIIIIIKIYRIYLNLDVFSSLDRCIYISLMACIGYPLLLSATYRSVSFGFILALFLIIRMDYNDTKIIR